MTTTYTETQAIDTLAAEGYERADIRAAFDSMVSAGLELDQPDEGYILTGEELGLLREQLDA